MSIACKISAFNRRRKWKEFIDILKPTPKTTILDVGFSEEEYSQTENYLEKYYPYPRQMTALGIDFPQNFLKRYPQIKTVHYDGKRFPFSNKEFDICWSNAVIEHVGDRENQVFFLREMKRVGKISFVTTPNKHFPVEVHTRTPLLHFLPKSYFDKYLSATGKKWAAGDYMNLLSLKDLQNILNAAKIYNYRIIKNRLFWFVLDFVIIF